MKSIKKTIGIIGCLLFMSMTMAAAGMTKRFNPFAKEYPTDFVTTSDSNIAVWGKNIYLTWRDYASNWTVYFKRSVDGGKTWQTSRRLSAAAHYSYDPDIAADGLNVYVVWDDKSDNETYRSDIYLRKSTDGGVTWQKPIMLSNGARDTWRPVISVNGSNVYVVWMDRTTWGIFEIRLRKSTDGGKTWQAEKRLTRHAGKSMFPAAVAKGSNVYVAWNDDRKGNYEIYLRKSATRGGIWLIPVRLTNNASCSWSPDIAVGGSNVYVAWSDYASGNYEIYFIKSADGGKTWQAVKRLSNDHYYSWCPHIAVKGPNVYVIWNKYAYYETNKDAIYFRKSSDGGKTWQGAKNLAINPGCYIFPAIAVCDSNIYATWDDDSPGYEIIYFTKSSDGGETWLPPVYAVNNSDGGSIN